MVWTVLTQVFILPLTMPVMMFAAEKILLG